MTLEVEGREGKIKRIQPNRVGSSPAVEGDDEWTAGELLGVLLVHLMITVTPYGRRGF